MKFEVYDIPFHAPKTADTEEDMLLKAVKKILNNCIKSTKFMLVYNSKYEHSTKWEHGVVYFEYDIDTDTIIFENDYNEGGEFVYDTLWMLPQEVSGTANYTEIINHNMRECIEQKIFEYEV